MAEQKVLRAPFDSTETSYHPFDNILSSLGQKCKIFRLNWPVKSKSFSKFEFLVEASTFILNFNQFWYPWKLIGSLKPLPFKHPHKTAKKKLHSASDYASKSLHFVPIKINWVTINPIRACVAFIKLPKWFRKNLSFV